MSATATNNILMARSFASTGINRDAVRAAMVGFGIPQVDADGACDEVFRAAPAPELSRFKAIAERSVARGDLRLLPIEPDAKSPAIKWKDSPIDLASTSEWAALASTWIEEQAEKFPNHNAAIIAKSNEKLFIDEDKMAEFRAGYEEFSEEKFPVTFTTSARENRAQSHWLQTDATRLMGNVPQASTPEGIISVRQNNLYVLAEGSVHPSGSTYRVIVDAPVVPMPDKLVEYILYLKSQVVGEKGKLTLEKLPRNAEGKVIHGSIHDWLLLVGSQLRGIGKTPDEIEKELLRRVHEECAAPIDERKVRQVAQSMEGFPAGHPTNIALNQPQAVKAAAPATAPQFEIDRSEGAVRPQFPVWAIEGTSIYENLVKPALATSSKHAEFIFVPAMQMMMNYLSGNVDIELQPTNLNLFVGLVSPYGQFFKSSSCKLAHDYFQLIGACSTISKERMSEGKVMVAQAGSPEGFGLLMKKMSCNRAILFNDEFGKFVSKAGIEGSSFSSDLLSWYGAADFGNSVTSSKNNFHFEAGKYTFGWLWATTDRGFNRHWPKLAGISSGLEDRMFFVVSPEKPKPTVPFVDPPLMVMGAVETRKLIDQALQRKKFQFENYEAYVERVSGMDPRSMEMVKKLALYFAIDLGLDVIDTDCVERAKALVEYRNQASAFLEPIEADNIEGRLQKEILRELKQHRGAISYRDLCRNLDFTRHGLRVWDQAYKALVLAGLICEFQEAKTAGKRTTRMVGLVKHDDDE